MPSAARFSRYPERSRTARSVSGRFIASNVRSPDSMLFDASPTGSVESITLILAPRSSSAFAIISCASSAVSESAPSVFSSTRKV